MPAAPASTQQPAVSSPSSSGDYPNSFASYLKSVASPPSDQQPDDKTPGTKLAAGAKDKTSRDPQKSDDDKNKLLLSNTAVPVIVPLVFESKPLTWTLPTNAVSLPGNTMKSEARNSGQPDAAATGGQLANPDSWNAEALKTGAAEAPPNAPVAFGVSLSKVTGAKLDGLKTDAPKTVDAKSNEAPPKSASNETGKAGESSKLAESRNSSRNQPGSFDSSGDNRPAPNGNVAKAAAPSAHTQTEGFAAIHTDAPAGNQMAVVAETVHHAYAPAAVGKIAPAGATAAVAEPPRTPAMHPQNIDLKIAGADNSEVDVRVSQRAGDVQVTVRTPDGDLAQSLRQHLPELSDRLSQAGSVGEVWQPQAAQASNTGGNNADSRYSDDAQTQQQQHQQQHSGGHPNRQQQNETAQQPAWLQELNQAEKETK